MCIQNAEICRCAYCMQTYAEICIIYAINMYHIFTNMQKNDMQKYALIYLQNLQTLCRHVQNEICRSMPCICKNICYKYAIYMHQYAIH